MDRTHRELTDDEVARIARTSNAWRGEQDAGPYEDVAGFCKSAALEEIRKHGHVARPLFLAIQAHIRRSAGFTRRADRCGAHLTKADAILTQAEGDALIALAKYRVDMTEWAYPDLGGAISVPLVSADRREHFLLDIRRGRIDLAKGTYQNRGRQVVVLVRLDFGGAPHRNPDGEEIDSPHLHLYREGFGRQVGDPRADGMFGDVTDRWRALQDFMQYCDVAEIPLIRRGLFT